jgi:hypothetical protein
MEQVRRVCLNSKVQMQIHTFLTQITIHLAAISNTQINAHDLASVKLYLQQQVVGAIWLIAPRPWFIYPALKNDQAKTWESQRERKIATLKQRSSQKKLTFGQGGKEVEEMSLISYVSAKDRTVSANLRWEHEEGWWGWSTKKGGEARARRRMVRLEQEEGWWGWSKKKGGKAGARNQSSRVTGPTGKVAVWVWGRDRAVLG